MVLPTAAERVSQLAVVKGYIAAYTMVAIKVVWRVSTVAGEMVGKVVVGTAAMLVGRMVVTMDSMDLMTAAALELKMVS